MTEQFIGMSTTMEEDTELRDLLIEKLKTNGTLDKIRVRRVLRSD